MWLKTKEIKGKRWALNVDCWWFLIVSSRFREFEAVKTMGKSNSGYQKTARTLVGRACAQTLLGFFGVSRVFSVADFGLKCIRVLIVLLLGICIHTPLITNKSKCLSKIQINLYSLHGQSIQSFQMRRQSSN